MLATYCQGLEEVAQALVPEGSCCGWPFNEALVILVTTLSVAFPSKEYYSMKALAEHALALSMQLSTSMQMYN